MPLTLRTDRLTLRALESADAEPMFELARDRRVADTTASLPHPYERHMADDFIASRSDALSEQQLAVWAVVLREEGRFVGIASLSMQPELDSTAIGYWLGVPFWGRGIATEASAAMIDHAFATTGLGRVHGVHLVRNAASHRVMEKVAMRLEGVCRRGYRKWGVLEDLCYHSLLREEWQPRS